MTPTICTLKLGYGGSEQALLTKPGNIPWASLIQDYLATSKLNLFDNTLTVNSFTTKAELDAAVATFDGYAEETIATFSTPIFDSEGGASTNSGIVTFAYVDGVGHVGNTVNGWWLEDAAGNVMALGNFADPVLVQANGDGVQVIVEVNIGAV